jgi:glycosyltransferase involved in cell wall biosynthesis
MEQSPYVSVVVPCFNHARFLPEALQSVFDQTFTNWECIIVNDGSPDNTSEVAREWIARDPRFSLVEKVNGGLSSARNAGIRSSSGELILPLDADDRLHPSFLEKAVEVSRQGTLAGNRFMVVSTYIKAFGESTWLFESKKTTIDSLVVDNTIVCTSLYPRSLWVKVAGYDESLKQGFEDWDFWIRCADMGAVFDVIEEYLFLYRQHKSSMLTQARLLRVDLVGSLVQRNRPVFSKYLDQAICARERRILQLESQLAQTVEQHAAHYTALLNTKDYLIGRAILFPFRFCFRLVKSFATWRRDRLTEVG